MQNVEGSLYGGTWEEIVVDHEKRLRDLEAKLAVAVDAIEYVVDGMGIDGPSYDIDPDDDYLDAANSEWVKGVLTRLSAALAQIKGEKADG